MNQTALSDEEKKRLLDGLEELRQLSEEAICLLRLLSHAKYEKAVSSVLPSKEQRVVYEHSDGTRSSRHVAEIAGVSHSTVNRWWGEWAEKGMGGRVPVRGGGQGFLAKYTPLELALAVLEGEAGIQ